MQSSLIHEEIEQVWLSQPVKVSTGVINRKGEEREKQKDEGSERQEEIGETDHLHNVGRQHKLVGEGRSLLDSVLQKDGNGDTEAGMTKMRGQRMVVTGTEKYIQREF